MRTNAGMMLQNPVLPMDFPYPDIIRVNDTYYMASSSIHFTPGIPILRSKNLANWELTGTAHSGMFRSTSCELAPGRAAYGQGPEAPSLRYNNGVFYLCFNRTDHRATYVCQTTDIEAGRWECHVLPGMHHDPSLLFDEGRCYLVYGQGSIYIKELTANAREIKKGGTHQMLVATPRVNGVNCEGSHIYKVGKGYYLFLSQWPAGGSNRRVQWCYHCEQLLGHYEGQIVLDDALGQGGGVAGGGIVNTPDGRWFALLEQDCGAVGHCPVLVPVAWEKGWPVLGVGGRVPARLAMPCWPLKMPPLVGGDDFEYDSNRLAPVWQWNHDPDPKLWSVTKRHSHLRLENGTITPDLAHARNILTQRTVAPQCVFETKLDTDGMLPGDVAGIAAFQAQYGFVGIAIDKRGQRHVVAKTRGLGGAQSEGREPYLRKSVHLRIEYDFTLGADKARFFYSPDARSWKRIGDILQMKCTLDHLAGYRTGLFSYATKTEGGYADFDYMHVHYEQAMPTHINIHHNKLYSGRKAQ